MKTRILVLILSAFCGCAWAQAPQNASAASEASSPKPELPTGPLLGKIPDFSNWTITFVYASEIPERASSANQDQLKAAYLGKRPSKVTTTKTGDITHEVTRSLMGVQTEIWSVGGLQYYQSFGAPQWFESGNAPAAGGVTDVNPHQLPASGFRNLEWINAENYAGTVSHAKGSYLVFVPGGYQKLDLRDSSKQKKLLEGQPRLAYIDSDTRMPVAVREGDTTRFFQFNPPPTAMQTLPADLSKSIADGKEGRRRLEQPAARPY